MAPRQLRDGRGREPAAEHPLLPLPATLPGAEAGARQRRLLWQTHPLRLHGLAHPPSGHQVGLPTPNRHKAHPTPSYPDFHALAHSPPGLFTTSHLRAFSPLYLLPCVIFPTSLLKCPLARLTKTAFLTLSTLPFSTPRSPLTFSPQHFPSSNMPLMLLHSLVF